MGNRAIVVFTDKHSDSGMQPAVYMHNTGSETRDWLKKLREVMRGREGDASYAAARFTQLAGNHIGGNMSLGLVTIDLDEDLVEQGPGDAGVFVVDTRTWTVENHGGRKSEGAFSGKI